MDFNTFYEELLLGLPSSDGSQRIAWAKKIVEENVDLINLSSLLYENKRVALRFSWLLSDVAMVQPQKLFEALPYLFERRSDVQITDFQYSFAKYWNYCGVPTKQEGIAIDHLFKWIESPSVSVHIKTNALTVLNRFTIKYPDLKNELQIVLTDQVNKNSVSFKKMAERILADF